MACLTPVTIRIDTPTGPLNSAAYDSGRDKIFAVRDNWIYQLNATTGAKEAASRFAYPGIPSDTYIDYDSSTDMLWATYWRGTPDNNTGFDNNRFIARIDPDDITSVTLYSNSGAMSPQGFTNWEAGFTKIITRSGIGYALYSAGADPAQNIVARINLSIPQITHSGSSVDSESWGALFHDGTNLLYCGNDIPGNDTGGLNPADLTGAVNVGNMPNRALYGITRDPGNGFAYMATATQYVVRGEVTGGAPTSSEIDLGRANANPHNIRYNANDLLIYIPLYKDDTVAVLDPSDDSFEIKSGFTAPWDVVFTPTKKFALQHAAIGIREIT